MIFAPMMRRATVAYSPRAADVAVQRFMADALRSSHTSNQSACRTGVQFSQDEKTFTLQIDVPGLTRDQLNIQIEDAVVRVNSIEGAPRTVKGAWELPEAVAVAGSSAKLDLGVLTLTLARVQPEARTTRLSID